MIQKNKLFVLFFTIVNFICFSYSLSLCPNGYFKLGSMKYCFPWLTCSDLSNIKILQEIGFGSTKTVYLAMWNNYYISYIKLRNKSYQYDFYSGLSFLKALSPNNQTVQLVGFCEKYDIILTENHKNGNALNVYTFQGLSVKQKFKLCLSYAQILLFLHNSPIGVRVNCDSNDLSKLLSQLLVTDDLNLVLTDVDALPEVTINSSIKCGPREIKTNFAAPEQKWRRSGPFNVKQMKGYDEKTDVWKLPDVCMYFLKGKDYLYLQYELFNIHKQCKEYDPAKRPNVGNVISVYNNVFVSL